MEPEVREFLARISQTIGLVVMWMFINSTIGIMFGWAFTNGHVTTGNIIFYIWFVLSLVLMVWMLIRLWKGKTQRQSEN